MAPDAGIPPALDQFIVAMPKVELHLHLEGSVLPATARELAAKHGRTLPFLEGEDVERSYQFRDFPHFIEAYVASAGCLREPDDFTRVVIDLGQDAARQNIRYLEVFFSPEPHVRTKGLSFDAMLAGMNAGRAEAQCRWGIEMRWIADGVRGAEVGPISVTQTVEWISRLELEDGVIGLGLGGNEVNGPPHLYVEDFAAARASGLHIVAHAGETTGSQTIWDTIHLLQAERIGHGVRAIEDPALVAYLAEHQIPLELCPTSNVCIGVVPAACDHPFRRLDDAGVLVTVNSDDPPLFGTTLTDEYRLLAREFGYDSADLERITLNAVHASFLPAAEKSRLASEIAAECAALRQRVDI
jgi:adenosine deaminase